MNANYHSSIDLERLGRLGVVLAAHVVLALAVVYAMHAPKRHIPEQHLVVTLLADLKPAPIQAPLPLRALKQLPLPALPELPPIPIEIANRIALAAPASMSSVAEQPLREMHTEPKNDTARATDDSTPMVDANAAGNPKPSYPKISRALGEQGCVLLDVYVQTDGTVGDIRLHQTSGFERLDDSALRAVRKWHFKPARQAGKQMAMWYVQPVNFNLHNA